MDGQKWTAVVCRTGAGKVLTGLNKRIDKDVQSILSKVTPLRNF